MAKVRIGFSTQFEVENETVGIGTDSALDTLHVTGDIIAHNIDAGGGITTVKTYSGFIDKEVTLTNSNINLNSQSHALSGEIIIDNDITVSSGTTFTSGPENLTVTDNFTLPGISDDRPTAGTMRFNENLAALEFYNGVEWKAVNSQVDVNGGGSRGIISGGFGDWGDPGSPQGQRREIQWFNTATQGNTQYFGDLVDCALPDDSNGNTIRVVNHHGTKAGLVKTIDYITIATTGDAINFGESTEWKARACAIPSSTRGIFAGGMTPSSINIIDYVELMTTGDALDFGDIISTRIGPMGASNGTRGVIAGGYSTTPTSLHHSQPANGYTEDIQIITIASKGNSTDWGTLSYSGGYGDCAYNTTRALFAGGYAHTQPFRAKDMCSLTIASGGNAFDFGVLHAARAWNWGAGTGTRGFFGGGNAWPSQVHYNTIEYVSMNSLGSAIDFGDMVVRAYAAGGITNAHGGLGGF